MVDWLRKYLAWNQIFRALSYYRSALWVVPILAVVLARIVFRLMQFVDDHATWHLIDLDPDGARAAFQTIVTLTLTFVVFTFGSLLVAIQIAGGQLTPRIIATTLLRDRVIKYAVGLNVFTLMLAVSALNRTADSVHHLTTVVVSLLGVACLAAFLFLIDYTARLLRPVSIVALVCDEGMEVVRDVYRVLDTGNLGPTPSRRADVLTTEVPTRTVLHRGRSEVVLAVRVDTLVAEATRTDGIIEFVPQVGDFVATDDPLLRLYGGACALDDVVIDRAIALGPERTIEQDPVFAFRILVDVALKALSPAINDPTTAVLALDQLHRLLRYVGKRHLHDEVIHDAAGRPRVILRTPNWEDFVNIACSEIRACGANNMQIARRMRAMLDNLVATLPARRHAALLEQLDLLDRALPEHFKFAEELALARVPDSQGLGGASAVATNK